MLILLNKKYTEIVGFSDTLKFIMTKKIVWCSYDESWVVTDAYFCWRSEYIPGDLDELWYHPFEHRKCS